MNDDRLRALSRTRLETLQLAVGAILNVAEEGLLSDPLESELWFAPASLEAAMSANCLLV